jgi:hypothetical protein
MTSDTTVSAPPGMDWGTHFFARKRGAGVDHQHEFEAWQTLVGKHYVFHLHSDVLADTDIRDAIVKADERYPVLSQELLVHPVSIKRKERFSRTNYWLHRPRLPEEAPVSQVFTLDPEASLAQGWVDTSGIHFGVQNRSWLELVDSMTHEEVHAIWGREVGEAPSLLNEGMAVWYEIRLSSEQNRVQELCAAWRSVIESGEETLDNLCRTNVFWDAYSRGLSVYGVAGVVIGYLLNTNGLAKLNDLFLRTHYEDEHLADMLMACYKRPADRLMVDITDWVHAIT